MKTAKHYLTNVFSRIFFRFFKVRELVPESQAYMDLLAFERKLDSTIMRKRLDIQEALKRPMKQKRKLRIFISNTTFPAKEPAEGGSGDEPSTTGWELRVEGRLLDEDKKVADPSKSKRKFSSFFKSLVIELDKDLYGPDNHLVEWRRIATTQETDGFQVRTNSVSNSRQKRIYFEIFFINLQVNLQYWAVAKLSAIL